jgi:hypothetical protein
LAVSRAHELPEQTATCKDVRGHQREVALRSHMEISLPGLDEVTKRPNEKEDAARLRYRSQHLHLMQVQV